MGISKIGPREFYIRARVLIPDPDPTKPRQDRRKRERFQGTQAQAEERYLAMKAELRGEQLRKEARTFGDLLRNYEESRGVIPLGQKTTWDALMEDLGAVDLRILPTALRHYSNLLRRAPSKATGKVLANGTINRRRAMVATVLSMAVELKDIRENPLTKSLWPKLKEIPRDRFLTAEEEARLMAALESQAPHLVAIVRFAALVPCRKSELVRMTKADLDLFNNAIRVHNGTTKNDEGVWKPIPPDMVPYFRSLPPECPWLFYRLCGGQYRPLGDFKHAWDGARKAAGIENFRFHDTRHTAATGLANAGTPERVIMAVAGWKTNMLSTYWKNLGRGNLSFVRFPSVGSGTQVAPAETRERGNLDSSVEKAVS